MNKILILCIYIFFFGVFISYATISWPTTPDGETSGGNIGSLISTFTVNSGNVGIGKTPTVKLDVNGDISATNIAGTITTTSQPNITSIGTLTSLTVGGNIAGTLSTASQPNITGLGTLSSLNVTGNVGIGTTSPSNNLHIVGNLRVGRTSDNAGAIIDSVGGNAVWDTTGSTGVHYFKVGGVNKMTILANGNVGIGTLTPGIDLDVVDSDLSHIRALITGQTNNPSIYMLADETNNKGGLFSTAPTMQLGANNTIQMTFSGGNVGIGTTSPTVKLEVIGRIKDETGFITPVGSILSYAGTSSPEGWLICDGSAISRVIYDDLFVVIGETYGVGDGSTTFNIPDMRGVFVRGLDSGRGLDTGRILSNTYQTDSTKMPSSSFTNSSTNTDHTHNTSIGTHSHGFTWKLSGGPTQGHGYPFPTPAYSYYRTNVQNSTYPDPGIPSSFYINSANLGTKTSVGMSANSSHTHTISGGDNETRPTNIALNYMIKY